MSLELCLPEEARPLEEAAAEDQTSYDLDEERWRALPQEARVAMAIAGLGVNHHAFKQAKDITAAIASETDLTPDEVKESNRALLQRNLLDRSGFLTGDVLSLALNDDGYAYLEREVVKVQPDSGENGSL